MHDAPFSIHPALRQDCFVLGQFSLSYLLLMNDSQYPWCILVPARDAVTEVFQLNDADRQQLAMESNFLSESMYRLFKADKMNTAALGNIVPQLHIHHVARFSTDVAWPAPIWGATKAVPYSDNSFFSIRERLYTALNESRDERLSFSALNQ